MKYFGLLILIFTIVSCKYKEGPLFDLESAEGRIIGEWRIEKIFRNGNPITTIKCLPDTSNSSRLLDLPLFFKADYQISAGVEITPYCYYAGYWNLKNEKKIISVNFERQRCFSPFYPEDCDSIFLAPVLTELKILRLTKKYYSKNNKTYIQGNLWVEEKRNDGTYEFHFLANEI